MLIPFRRTPIAAAVGAALCTPLPSHAFPIIAIGNEFELAEDVGNTNQQTPDIAIADDGSFVAVWEEGGEIFAQRFAADGTRRGGEISVPRADAANTANRVTPVVAMDDDGDFAVAWQALYNTITVGYFGQEVAFQRFDADGNSVASARRATDDLDATGITDQQDPAIAMDADGDIVIAWEGYVSAADIDGVGYRLFNAGSGAATATAAAASDPTGNSVNPAVSRSGTGEFVIAWFNDIGEVFARRFGAGGTPLAGTEIQVTAGASFISQPAPDVAMDDDGDFAVVWQEYIPPYDLNYRAFRIDGSEFIGQTLVAAGNVETPTIGMLDNDEAVIAWEETDGDGNGVFISSFDSSGNLESGPLAVNQTTTGNQDKPALAMDPDGDIVVGFESYVSGTEDDVLARRFAPNFISGKSGGPGSFGWFGIMALGLAAAGRRLLARRRKRTGATGLLAGALALGGLGGLPDTAVAAGPQDAGRVESARGTVTASRDGESRQSLAAGDPVYVGDRVRTGADASATLALADGTEVDLQAHSVFRVSALEPGRGGNGFGGMFMDLLRGGLRMITGQVAESDPARYRLRTPVATIGVRGTEFRATVCRAGDDCPRDRGAASAGRVPAARVLDLHGVIEVVGANGAVRVVDAGDGVYEGDTVETRAGAWGVLEFADGSRVSLQPDTRFRVDQWDYERAEPDAGNALLNLLRGGVRILTGLIGDEMPAGYRVQTPVATIGVRGTGFDLFCVGTCLEPDAAAGAIEADGLYISSWDGTAFAELEGTVAEFAAGETGFMANPALPPVRVPSLPPALQDPVAPRPDRVTGRVPDGAEKLHARVEEGTITVQGATGAPLVVGAGAAAVVTAGGAAGAPAAAGAAGADAAAAPATGAGVASIGTAVGALIAGQFDLAAPYAGAATGSFNAGSKSGFERRIRDDHPDASVNSLDGSGTGGRVFGGIRLLEVLAFEVGYVDMGELESQIDPGSGSPGAVADDALDDHPVLATGYDFSTLVRTPLGINTWAFARAGVLRWESEITTTTADGQRFSRDVSGTDPLVGGGVEYRIGPGTHARAEWIRYELDPDPVDYVGAGVVWSF